MSEEPTLREKARAVRTVAGYRPWFAAGIVAVNLVTALLEGVGVGLLLPIIETAQSGDTLATQDTGVTGYFAAAYGFVGLSPTLETLLLGLAAVMTVRYGLSFLTTVLQVQLRTQYIVHLRQQCFEHLLGVAVSFVDERDDDELLNTIVTEIAQSSAIVQQLLDTVQTVFFISAYMTVALLIAPRLTFVAVVVLGTVVFLTRYAIRPGYEVGEGVAAANERIQGLVTAGIRGIREIKLFNMFDDVKDEYRHVHSEFERTNVALARNQAAIANANQLLNALALFALVYVAIDYLTLSFASLGVFLFAMFRLSPQISSLNNTLYAADGDLPHLVRCQNLVDELRDHAQSTGGEPAPDPVTEVTLENVTFQYDHDADGTDLSDVSLRVENGETVALVGPSGAGKSTIVSLIARLYEPDAGRVTVDGTNLGRLKVDSWHDRVAVVPQHPFVFNETLRYNVTISNPDASERAVRQACETSQVSAFLDELPNGLDTELGDDGVKLSGGQRQRVAVARALLTDADVLILDEATSELDTPTEETILDGIASANPDYLTIVVGHTLSTVHDADRIYTVVDGEVVETGTHRELVAADSHYADLYASQLQSTTES